MNQGIQLDIGTHRGTITAKSLSHTLNLSIRTLKWAGSRETRPAFFTIKLYDMKTFFQVFNFLWIGLVGIYLVMAMADGKWIAVPFFAALVYVTILLDRKDMIMK